jgi:hypothetical protein
MTWDEIAKLLKKEQNVLISRQGVQDFFKRRRGKPLRILMGMEPETETIKPTSEPKQTWEEKKRNNQIKGFAVHD